MTSKFALYFHTLRYLKPSQVCWRLWFKLVQSRADNSRRPDLRQFIGRWELPARRRQSFFVGDMFYFLNKSGSLSKLGWDGPERDKLWRYNQHYFDDLNAINSDIRTDWHFQLVERWIQENAVGCGVGWDPYPTSLRIVNWVKWGLAGHSLRDEFLQSLASQIRWLSNRLERHILGNHLFANAKALVFAGVFFGGFEAQKWLRIGLDIIARELSEQVLPDGGNFERSPMYHAIFLEDVLDLINLMNAYPGMVGSEQINHWRHVAAKMLNWLEIMCHPDGEIPFFNDAAIGVAPSPSEIKAYASRLRVFVTQLGNSSYIPAISRLPESGYIRLDASNAVAFLDVAPVGPDYLPGHAHADTLSFELSLFGERVFVNSGTSQYGSKYERLQERGTKAHNTVVINGKNSSEIWSGFRVARRAYPKDLEVKHEDSSIIVNCSHDGYTHLSGHPVHKRSWQLCQGKLIVRDQIAGQFEMAIANFHFHPNVKVTAIDNRKYLLSLPISGEEIQLSVLKGSPSIEQSFFAPEFGIRMKSQCLAIRFESCSDIIVKISWSINE